MIITTAHTPAHHEAHSATVDEEGNTEYWTCSGCGKFFSDAECKTETTQEDTVIAKRDSLTDWVTEGSGIEFDEGNAFMNGGNDGITVALLYIKFGGQPNIKISDSAGNALSEDKTVGTGCIITLSDSEGAAVNTLIIVITGDTDGDGKISSFDCILTKAHLLGKQTLDGAYKKAAENVGEASGVTLLVYIRMKGVIFGQFTMTELGS